MRRVIIVTNGKWAGMFPQVLKNISYIGTRKPARHEWVILETKDGEILKDDAKVEIVNPEAKTYDVRVW